MGVAYFSMEIGLSDDIPTYSGGLGVLAGDSLKGAADVGIPMCGITLLYAKGYFSQKFDGDSRQIAEPVNWSPSHQLERLDHLTLSIPFRSKQISLVVWRYSIKSPGRPGVDVYFLDARHPDNSTIEQSITAQLYAGDHVLRVQQEWVLAAGGSELLRQLGGDYQLHLNEGHAAFVPLLVDKPIEEVRRQCSFTTHTPVAAGHDRFPWEAVEQQLPVGIFQKVRDLFPEDNELNMTLLALRYAGRVNAVAKKHAEVTRRMFPGTAIDAITNGIHAPTWAHPAFARLFDEYCKGWRRDSGQLRHAITIPLHQFKEARLTAKKELLQPLGFSPSAFTIGFARRSTTYKRMNLLFADSKRLEKMSDGRPIQLIFAGKAHPKDLPGQEIIAEVKKIGGALKNVRFAFLPNYEMALGARITAGVDLWLNNPVKPLEASGTSGMKAALNGIPSFSTLDGWWLEGCLEGVTGWEIPDSGDALEHRNEAGEGNANTADALYGKLEQQILPLFYDHPDLYQSVGRYAIAVNGSFFNTHRMMLQYQSLMYQ